MQSPSGIYLPYGNPSHALTAISTDRRIAISYRKTGYHAGVSLSSATLSLKEYTNATALGGTAYRTTTINLNSSPYNTANGMGALVDYINGTLGAYGFSAMPLIPRSYFIGAAAPAITLSAETECSVKPDRSTSANWWGGHAILGLTTATVLTTGFDYMSCYVGNSDLYGSSSYGRINAISSIVASWANAGTTEANKISVYAMNPYTKEEYLIGGPYSLGADPANVIIDRADFGGDFLMGPPNGFDLCVVCEGGAASGADLTAPVISVYGGSFDVNLPGRTQWTPAER